MADGWFDSVLESTPARFLLGGMPYMATRERQMEQEQAAKTFGGLLDQERMQVPATPVSDQGPVQPTGQEAMLQGFKAPGGLLGATPQSSFYLDVAAKVPQLTGQMVTKAQEQQAAMDRQVQDQTWRQSNMTASELANYTLQQERMRVDQEWRQYEHKNPSAYQRGQLGIAGGNLALAGRQDAREAAQFDINNPINPQTGMREPRRTQNLPTNMEIGLDGATPVPLPGTPEYSKAYESVAANNSLLSDLTSYRQMVTGGGVSFTGEKARTADAMRTQLVTRLAKSIAGEGLSTTQADIDRAETLIPSLTSLMGNDKKALQGIDEIIRSESARSAANRSRYQNYRGLPPAFQPKAAPPGFK